MSMEYQFIITTPLELEETVGETKILSGTFLRLNKATKNGREYQIEEGETIAEGLVDMPIGFGADWLNRHIKSPANHIGRVISAWFDEVSNTIKGKVQVWNTAKFPNIIERVKSGWGFSIGGTAKNLLPTGVLNALGKAIMRVLGMKPNHLQLLEPETRRGQQEARVEDTDVEESYYDVEETLSFDPCPWGICDIPDEIPVMESDVLIRKEDWEDVQKRLKQLEEPKVPEAVVSEPIVTEPVVEKPVDPIPEIDYLEGKVYVYNDGKFVLQKEEELEVIEPVEILTPETETPKYEETKVTYIVPGKGVKKIRNG